MQTKKDHSPVTTADLEVNRILSTMQQQHFPDDGGCQRIARQSIRLQKSRVWIVDPIDGTQGIRESDAGFCISAALVTENRPAVAAIFNPSPDELFTAVRGGGLHLNGARVESAAGTELGPVVMVSPWELRSGRWATLYGTVHCCPMYSIANALALVAAGRVHATITIEPENEWDLAAGVLLVEESGGTIHDAAGKPFFFNQAKPKFRGVIAIAAAAAPHLHPLLQHQADRLT